MRAKAREKLTQLLGTAQEGHFCTTQNGGYTRGRYFQHFATSLHRAHLTDMDTPAPAATGPSETALDVSAKQLQSEDAMDTQAAQSKAQVPEQTDGKEEAPAPMETNEAENSEESAEAAAENEEAPEEPKLTLEQAHEKMAEGRRHLKCHEYAQAADCLSAALAT